MDAPQGRGVHFFILTVGIDSGDEFRLREYIYNGNFCAEDMGGKLK